MAADGRDQVPVRSLATFAPPPPLAAESTALQVTDPLVIYRAKVARGELEEDEEQLRALVELRRINRTLRDYVPPAHLLGILNEDTQAAEAQAIKALQQHAHPKHQHDRSDPQRGQSREKIGELVRWLSESEGLAELGTPKGLMITGTPGTGKSMVMDIFYDSLPTKYKFRRHYHHLLLDLYKIIWEEAERRRIALRYGGPRNTVAPRRGLGSVWVREGKGKSNGDLSQKQGGWKRMLEGMPFMRYDSLEEQPSAAPDIPGPDGDVVKTTLPLHAAAHLFLRHGHILLFDEIQLVDVASAGLLRRTLEAYWRLGGVVIGTSNRIPKDLYASNVQRGQLTQFLEILGERCPNFEMRKTRDFRREPFYRQEWLQRKQLESEQRDEGTFEDPAAAAGSQGSDLPPNRRASYFVRGEEGLYALAVEDAVRGREGIATTIEVYGRKVLVPFSIPSSDRGPSVCRFTFEQLCDSPLGPADYLTLASTYHTFIIDKVPQLTLLQKNQARRLITLLDAVYEAGCRMILLADSSPDDLFFPDAKDAARHAAKGAAAGPGTIVKEIRGGNYHTTGGSGEADDVVDMSANGGPNPFKTPPPGEGYPEEVELEEQRRKSRAAAHQQRIDVGRDEFMTDSLIQMETLSEAMQDTEEGFRPNVLGYESRPDRSAGAAEALRQKEREAASLNGEDAAAAEALEAERQRQRELSDKVGFKHLAIFSGEDERFAYQRAVSRLFEMSHPDWVVRKSWRPFLDGEMDSWRGSQAEKRERLREQGFDPASAAVGELGDSIVRSELAEAHKHLSRAEDAAAATATAQAQAQAQAKAKAKALAHARNLRDSAPSSAAVDGDFADEASYESSTFPARDADPTYWTEEHRRYYDQPNRGASNAGLPLDGRPDFAPGPVGRRSRDGLPVLSDVHIWGVREDWGKRAGAWGKGAAVFERTEEEAQPDKEPTVDGEDGAAKQGAQRATASSAPRPLASTPTSSTPFHPTGRRQTAPASSPSSSRSSNTAGVGVGAGSRGPPRRGLHTTARRAAQVAALDHYKTLNVARTASKAQIKAQFYKLSKELHPDVNPSEDAKKQFQQVSEAYATLGSESARRSYDRTSSSHGASSSHGSSYGATPGYSYDASSNANRRARATYAWQHTRRTSPHKDRPSSSSSSSSHGRPPDSSIFNSTSTSKSHFETLADRQRRREEMASSRGRTAREMDQELRNQQAKSSSALLRFVQTVAMLVVVFKLGTMLAGPGMGRDKVRAEPLDVERRGTAERAGRVVLVEDESERKARRSGKGGERGIGAVDA